MSDDRIKVVVGWYEMKRKHLSRSVLISHGKVGVIIERIDKEIFEPPHILIGIFREGEEPWIITGKRASVDYYRTALDLIEGELDFWKSYDEFWDKYGSDIIGLAKELCKKTCHPFCEYIRGLE